MGNIMLVHISRSGVRVPFCLSVQAIDCAEYNNRIRVLLIRRITLYKPYQKNGLTNTPTAVCRIVVVNKSGDGV